MSGSTGFAKTALHPLCAAALLVVPVGVLGNKGLVPLLAVLALWAVERAHAANALKAVFRPLPVALALALPAWGLVSALWSVDAGHALTTSLRIGAIALAGLALLHAARTADDAARALAGTLLVVGFVLGLAALAAGHFYFQATGEALWGGHTPFPRSRLVPGETVLALMFWPMLMAASDHRRRIWATALGILALALFTQMQSEIVFIAVAAAIVAAGAVHLLGNRAVWLIAGAVAVYFIVMPFIVGSLPPPEEVTRAAADGPIAAFDTHRLYIWQFAADRIFEKPMLGWGMDASRAIDPEHHKVLWGIEVMPLHPHNAALQVWLELGLVGIVIAAAIVAMAMKGMLGSNAGDRTAWTLAGISAYVVFGGLSYGVWQNWWLAAGAIALVLMRMLPRPPIPTA